MTAIVIGNASTGRDSSAKNLVKNNFVRGNFPAVLVIENLVPRKLAFPEMNVLLQPSGISGSTVNKEFKTLDELSKMASSMESVAVANGYVQMVSIENTIDIEDANVIQKQLTEVTLVQDMGGVLQPCTITLKSADAGRKIELSTDGGSEYFLVTPDVTTATMLVTYVPERITHAKFTGAINDTITLVS
jgi:hypothetical protein